MSVEYKKNVEYKKRLYFNFMTRNQNMYFKLLESVKVNLMNLKLLHEKYWEFHCLQNK